MSLDDFANTRRGGKFFDKDFPALVTAITRLADDKVNAAALDAIRALLDGQEWTPDTVDAISEIVRGTGRSIEDVP